MAKRTTQETQPSSDLHEIRQLWLGVVQALTSLALVAAVFVACNVRASEVEKVAIPIDKIVTVTEKGHQSKWFEVEAEVFYPNSCFDPLLSYAYVNKEDKKIVLFHFAKELNMICTQALEPRKVFHRVAGLKGQVYEIWDGAEQRPIGELDLR